jgi:hypothetical protein
VITDYSASSVFDSAVIKPNSFSFFNIFFIFNQELIV